MRAPGPGVILLLLISLGGPLTGQELASWFASSPESAAYAPIRVEAENLVSSASTRGIPESLFVRRMREASEKHVPPARLLAALREDAVRFTLVSEALRMHGFLPGDDDSAAELLWQGALLLRAGAPSRALDEALDAAAPSAPQLPGRDGPRRAFEALGALVSVNARFALSEADFAALAAALVRSSLAEESFGSLVALSAKGRALGLPMRRVVEVIVRSLESGGSLDRIGSELERRATAP